MPNTKNKDKLEKCLKNKKAFTLVELIVVITILAILGTIAFISLQNYTKNSRDGVRIADINSVKKTLELFITDKGFYPLPDNGTPVTYSGATVWIQGTIGDNVTINLGRLNKKPVDPLTNSEYTYSLTTGKTEYQLSYITEEGTLGYSLPLLKQANAATTKTAIAMVTGTYNEKILKVSTGSNYYILAIPSIVNANLSDTNLQSIIDNKELVYNKYSNIPDSYKNKGYTMTGGFDFVPGSNIVIYSGSTSSTLKNDNDKITFLNNLKKVYEGSIIQSEPAYTEVLSSNTADINSTAVALVDTFINNNVGGITGTPTAIVYGCAVQPSYSGAIFTTGTPTLVNQTWQGTGSTIPCYYTCGELKVLVGTECVTEGCAGTTPDGTAKISNATIVNGGTWHYNTTGGVCTYTCNSDYHTENSGTTCVSNTRSCSITNGIGQQTWLSSRGDCTVVSCNGGFSQSSNNCLANSCATHQIYTNTSYTEGTPTQIDQSRQNSNPGSPCYYTCINGYSGSDCSIAPQISPTALSLVHSPRAKTFTFSWTAGTNNGGSCKLQYYRNGATWTDISATPYNCDSTLTNQSVTLPGDGWNSTWSSIQVRVIRTSDNVVLGMFDQYLTCSAITGSSTSTPSIDEDCNGNWDNIAGAGDWVLDSTDKNYFYGYDLKSNTPICSTDLSTCTAWADTKGYTYVSLVSQGTYINYCCYANNTGEKASFTFNSAQHYIRSNGSYY